MNKRNKSDTS